jgi:hypothetical protein
MTRIRAAQPSDRDRIAAFLEERGMRQAARLGVLHDPVADDALLPRTQMGSTA